MALESKTKDVLHEVKDELEDVRQQVQEPKQELREVKGNTDQEPRKAEGQS